jgi:Sec-independent protein translocase protein TatA
MKFFSLGAGELLLIMVFAILAVGPKETIRLASQARDVIGTIQKAFNEMSSEVSKMASDVVTSIDEPEQKE